ncbi:WhiB family transcriptional regulator [Bifidobacterium bombi]|uniref:Transcription factor WhiB family protein n=1 Tax=Bifidobacterium bombi DSM 19703 TaxID=1341695 RepID=A0A080N4M7_9BIFI|nr:WhiB family transcriptional regulator [Bifidobacterium bombi]KFF31540.1 transcription factor WhiB family protein [Bifidobacterium bombi DSM 19703]
MRVAQDVLRSDGELGWCRVVPSRLADLLWGLDDPADDDGRAGYELRRAGVRICEMCPVRNQCLALSMVKEAQGGIHGGLPLKARRQLKKQATAVGIGFDARNVAMTTIAVKHWLDDRPEEIAKARDEENTRRRERYARRAHGAARPSTRSD